MVAETGPFDKGAEPWYPFSIKHQREDVSMNIIGLLGGMSWESTVTYYQVINRRVQEAQIGRAHV